MTHSRTSVAISVPKIMISRTVTNVRAMTLPSNVN